MKPRIIFLDFDGVLNSVRNATADGYVINAGKVKMELVRGGRAITTGFDPVAVKLMWKLAQRADAYFIISSAWRISMSLRDIREMFHYEFGWPIDDENQRILGKTPQHTDSYKMRGNEIQEWIDNHTTGIRNFQYAIIDDSYDMLDWQMKRFVQTDPYEGFLYKDYTAALALFDLDCEEEII